MRSILIAPNNPTPVANFETVLESYGPSAWWKLNEANGSSTVTDYSGNGWTGTCAGVTLGATGPGLPGLTSNTACQFSTGISSNAIQIQANGPLTPFQTSDFSVIAMADWTDTGAVQNPSILSGGTNEVTDQCFAISAVPPNWTFGQWFDDWTSALTLAHEWDFICFTYTHSSKQGRFYKNGTASSDSPHTFGGVLHIANGTKIQIGNGISNVDPWISWIGSLAEVAIYNFVLTPTQISALEAVT